VTLTTKRQTPAAPKNSTGKLQNINKAATPKFFLPGVNACSRAVVNISPRTDNAAKDSKRRPTRNPVERTKVCLSSGRESADLRLSCKRGLCTSKTARYNQRFRKGRLGIHAPGRSIPQDL